MHKLAELLPNLELAPGWKTKGYTAVANKLILNKKLSASSRLVQQYLLLRQFGKNHDKPSYPSYETIAKDLGFSRPTVARCLKELKKQKLIEVKHRRNKTNLYFLNY